MKHALFRGLPGVWIFILAVTAFSGCGKRDAAVPAPAEEGIRDALGRSLSLSGPVRRVVSLSPSATEILFAIGAGEAVVGVTEFCDYPPEASLRTTVGGFSGPTISMDRIAALEPELVFLSADMHGRIIDLLKELRINSFALEPRSFADIYKTIEQLARITGAETGAARVIAGMQEKIRAAGGLWQGRETPGVFWEMGDEPLMTTGGGTFISEAIRLGGGRNIFEDLPELWPMVSPEQVLLRQPEWILAGDDYGETLNAAFLAGRPGWSSLPAIQKGRVGVVEADTINRYGPRLADAVLAIAKLLHEP
jgi:iron complex transport system substrate-binding protein